MIDDVEADRRKPRVGCFDDAPAFLSFFKQCYGPTIAVYRSLAAEPEKVRALDDALIGLGRQHDLGGGAMDWDT